MKPIWTQKREEREGLINELITQLDAIDTPDAKVMAGALDYYGLNKGKMPHPDFVVIRAELIAKAKDMIERASA